MNASSLTPNRHAYLQIVKTSLLFTVGKIVSCNSCGIISLTVADTESNTDQKWFAEECVQLLTLHSYREKNRFPLISVHLSSVSAYVSTSATVGLMNS